MGERACPVNRRWGVPAAASPYLRASESEPYTSARNSVGGGPVDSAMVFPRCQKCKAGDLIPLSDFGSQGAAIHYKAWVCTNPDCGFNLKIRNGDIYINDTLSMGNHSARIR